MEIEWANALKSDPPKSIYVKINSVYENVNSRPISFDVEYTIEGIQPTDENNKEIIDKYLKSKEDNK